MKALTKPFAMEALASRIEGDEHARVSACRVPIAGPYVVIQLAWSA
jgi:hypothetical protein